MELATPTKHTTEKSSGEDYLGSDKELYEEPYDGALFIGSLALGSKKEITPVDSLTGIPLPIFPRWRRLKPDSPRNNWHHHYHKSTDKMLTSQDGLAIRHSRLQLLPIKTHNLYHRIFEGPPLPKTNIERFGHIVLLSAGYIPREAIDVYSDDPSASVNLSDKKRTRLQSNGEIQLRGHTNISNFIKRHLVKQDLSHVNENIIEEFLQTADIERKRFLGHWLLSIASEVAIEPINPTYSQALDEGLITNKDQKLPSLVKSYINGPKTSKRALMLLHKNLKRKVHFTDSLQTGADELQFSG